MTHLRRFPAEIQEGQSLDDGVPACNAAKYDDDGYDDEDCYAEVPEPGTPGSLLRDLERRQVAVIAQLDELNAKIEAVLVGLGVKLDDDTAAA